MFVRRKFRVLLAVGLISFGLFRASPSPAARPWEDPATAVRHESVSERVTTALRPPVLKALVEEVLARNPSVAEAEARALAAAARAPQARALPDPMASVIGFVASPETRTGPQRLSLGLTQGLPWLGKRALAERAAESSLLAAESLVEAERLLVITEARRLFHEVEFERAHLEISRQFRDHLIQHEEISRVRYSTGAGMGQAVLKLQAEITRVESRLLEIAAREAMLLARLNALRDRPSRTAVTTAPPAAVYEVEHDRAALLDRALDGRFEILAADARIAQAETLVELAQKGYRPDLSVGLTYTVVGARDDEPGRLQPPAGNGDDIIGIQGGITLPVRRSKLAAALEEARARLRAERESKRKLAARVATEIADASERVSSAWRQLRLVQDLLIVQAEEALESVQAGYIAGNLDALDLLDAEHVLFEARTAEARARSDYLIGLARLSGAAAEPVEARAKE